MRNPAPVFALIDTGEDDRPVPALRWRAGRDDAACFRFGPSNPDVPCAVRHASDALQTRDRPPVLA